MDNRDKALLQRLHKLETDIQDFKAPQPVGTDSVRTYVNLTNDEWDVVWTAATDGFGYVKTVDVRFLSDHQNAPFGRVRVIADFNGVRYDPSTPDSAYLSSTRNYVSVGDDYLGNGFNPDNPMLEEFANPQLLRFRARCSAVAAGVVMRLKFIVDATDTGRVYIR